MLSQPWIALLKKLPAEEHNQLMVVTTAGLEMSVQTILVFEGDCLIFKGRLSGSQDAGRLFYVPYDRIDYIAFSRVVTEEEFRGWYSDLPSADASAQPAAKPGSDSGLRSPLPNRAALLERIRSRPSTAS
jgi:hypothetical protein